MIHKFLIVIYISFAPCIYATETFLIPKDTLGNRDYNYLFDRIEDFKEKKVIQRIYLDAFLKKAKAEKNWEETVNGYKNYLYYSPKDLKFVYADSMIYTAKLSKDDALIGAAYLSKGIVFYGQKLHNQALDNYLMANDFIVNTNDKYLKNKVKYNIAHIKYYLGFYDEALVLFNECLDYFKSEKHNKRAYLNTLHSLGLCYNRIGNYGRCSEINQFGEAEGERLSNWEMAPYFIHSEGINQFAKNNYADAIEKITHSIPYISENQDFANEAVGYFYIGKSYWELKKPEKAMAFFRMVDKIFTTKDYIRPDLRENYELIIEYYKSKKNPKTQLHYIEKLLKADSILRGKYKYLSGKIHKEYDTKELLQQKDDIHQLLQERKKSDILAVSTIVILFFMVLLLAYRHFKNKKLYRQKFEEVMQKNEVDSVAREEAKASDKSILDINPDAVASILKQLEKFERDKKFLETDWTLGKLAVSFNSNNTYLSKIIFHYRGKKFVEYLNDLKVDYIIELLKQDKMIRNYTNKALAEEVGFSSTQRFTNAFVSKTGISPTYFIKELKNQLIE